MEFRKGVLFVRLYGNLNINTIEIFQKEVKEVVNGVGIRYLVLNIEYLKEISSEGTMEIRKLRKTLKKTGGNLFLFGGEIRDIPELTKLDNELNVFGRVVI